jgi:hypothetical protein
MLTMVVGTASLAGAQTPAGDTARVNFDAAAAMASSVPTFTPKVRADFQAQQPRLGPSAEDSGISVGVLGMITRTDYKADGVSDFFDISNKTGYGFGLWIGGNRNGRVGFTGEFIYLKRGNDDFKVTALEIPAVFHVNFGSRSRNSVGGYIVLGPSFTINLKQEALGVDVSENFNGADVGLIGGVGVEFFRVGIEGRGNWGLRNINSSGDVTNTKTFTFELLGKFAFN